MFFYFQKIHKFYNAGIFSNQDSLLFRFSKIKTDGIYLYNTNKILYTYVESFEVSDKVNAPLRAF